MDDYKIQLAFDHERLVTSWVTVIVSHPKMAAGWEAENLEKAAGAVMVPFVNVELIRRGDKLERVRMKSFRLPDNYLSMHHGLVEEYRNASHWPKHLLVKYMWVNHDEVDETRGLMVLLFGGMITLTMALVGVLVTYKDKFSVLIQDVATVQVPIVGPSGQKSD